MAEAAPARYGQSHAAARAVEALLATGQTAGAFVLSIAPTTRLVRRTDQADIPVIGESVAVDCIPGDNQSDRGGIGGIYDDVYGVHIVMQQHIVASATGLVSESQAALLMRLRSEMLEYLCARAINAPDAVHPFRGAMIVAHRAGGEGVYDLARLESGNLFYAEMILTIRASGLRRKV